jgi:hypothetical protein
LVNSSDQMDASINQIFRWMDGKKEQQIQTGQ